MPTLRRYAYAPAFFLLSAMSAASKALAQNDLGLDKIQTIQGRNDRDIKTPVLDFLDLTLNFLALLAVIFIIVAGIRLIVSQGEQEQKDKAKKTIIYVVIGLIVVLVAKLIVRFVINKTLVPTS